MPSFFVIVINLSNFFTDHRRLARLCVNEAIQTIGDFQNRISDIFSIHDFHLLCNNHFLPPTEDVHIVKANELIWVMPNPGNTTAQQSIIDMPITPLHHSSVSYRKKKYSENEKRKLVDRDEVNADHSTEDTSEKTKGTLIANGVTNNINKSVDHEAEWKTIGNEDNNIEDEFPRSKKKKRKNMLMQSGESPFHPELNEEKNKVIVNENDNNIQEFVGPEIKNKDTLNEPDKDIEQRVPKRNKSKKKKNSPMNYMDLEETVPKRKKKKEESMFMKYMDISTFVNLEKNSKNHVKLNILDH
ncbi:unnamed protein product [Acanthoscelides obtectus]|uniref:Coilin N-terminal domain-containing protein n=1 Tax=Acanthoscelides obtectus TaxID=200917 RepID=A0A9P0LR38_ACAOB|nr:unnamed protein product [Acanthoscelides obtectus]CAK1648238.1 hypothetical protein AOBTE_LOCUS15613 [Acanthoscelides obtectus]